MRLMIFAAVALVSACASSGNDEGWTGNNATPFDSAVIACRIETQTTEGAQYEACMASKGWTRPQR
ncbi:MAG: hypothetical protein NT015_08855 [Alphaproteobacteria bacterium]|nr:hypothetical protein [Alphaproteobacteria bacterium]